MKTIITFLLLLGTAYSYSSTQPNHSIFNDLLKKYVSASGNVDYNGLKSEERVLDSYLSELKDNGPKGDWSENAKKAYYINAYNAYTLKFVVLKYPIKSVKNLSFSGKDVWNFRAVFLGNNTYTLKYLEDEILRKMRDARIHFAINCASISCPKLWNSAFTEKNVDTQLTTLTKAFINDKSHNLITEKKVKLSKIFEWYADDFIFESKSVIAYINKFSNTPINSDAKIEYLEYNWGLNQ